MSGATLAQLVMLSYPKPTRHNKSQTKMHFLHRQHNPNLSKYAITGYQLCVAPGESHTVNKDMQSE